LLNGATPLHGDKDRARFETGDRRQEEKVCQTLPTYSKPDAGESVGGLVGESVPSTNTNALPPGLVAVADRSAAIPALYAVSFSPRLRTAWLTDGRLQAWWQEYPDSPAWSEALNDLAGVDAEKRHVGMYLSIVKRLARRAAIPAAGPARRPSRNDLANDALRELKARRGMEARRDRG
jgi:hypothetical protein